MKLVIIESPFANVSLEGHQANIDYARKCMRDSLMRGEAPFASHLLYPQPHVLDERVHSERILGIEAGYAWGDFADLHAFYTDRGWSRGMLTAHRRLKAGPGEGKIELRSLGSKPIEPPPYDLDMKSIEHALKDIAAVTCAEGGAWHKPAAIQFSDGRVWDNILNSWRPA